VRVLRVFDFVFVFLLPPLNTVTGGTITPVCGSFVNWRTISILAIYLLRVDFLEALRVFFDLRIFLVFLLPPFNGIVVGHPIPPGKLHHT
jgi:hypothetical protein